MTDQEPTPRLEPQPAVETTPAPGQTATQPTGQPLPGQPAAAVGNPPGTLPLPPAWSYAAPAGLDVAVVPVARHRSARGPLRWVVALLVVALVTAGGLGAALLLTGSSSGASDLAAFVPVDSLTYVEGRLDLPGSQRAEVAKTLAAFPGFADQAALDTKLNEVFDRIVRAASSGKHDYQAEIAPWFGGQLAYATGPSDPLAALGAGAAPAPSPADSPTAALPPCSGGSTATPAPTASTPNGSEGSEPASSLSIRVLALASVKDPAKAQAWVGNVLGDSVTSSDRTCDGVTVHVVARKDGASFKAPEMGWAILGDRALIAGDLDSIRLAIATKGATGLGATQAFQKAVASLQGDHLGLVYEAVRAMVDTQAKAMARLSPDGTLAAVYGLVSSRLPEWIIGDLRAADGNLVADTVEPAPDGIAATNRASDLAGLAPAGTIALVDAHDVGKSLSVLHQSLAAEPKFKSQVDQVDRILGLLGGFDSVAGWIGDAGVALTRNGSSVSGGLLIRPDDASAATHLFTQIRSLAELSGAASALKPSDEDYKGATITTVDLSGLAPLLKSQSSSLGDLSIPSDLKLVYAVTDKVVVFTLDASFAKAVIDASQGGGSLAGDPRFSALLSKAGDKGTGLAWVDLAAARQLIEGALPADELAKYERDVKPYLLPFDALISTASIDNALVRGTTIVSIKH